MKYGIFVSILFVGLVAIAQCNPKNRKKTADRVDPGNAQIYTNAETAVVLEDSSWGAWFRELIGEENIQTAYDAKQKLLDKADEIIQSGQEFIGEENLEAARAARQNIIDKAGEIIQSGKDMIGEERLNAAAEKTTEYKGKVAGVLSVIKQKVVETVDAAAQRLSSDDEPIIETGIPVPVGDDP